MVYIIVHEIIVSNSEYTWVYLWPLESIPIHETAPLFSYKPIKLATYSLLEVNEYLWIWLIWGPSSIYFVFSKLDIWIDILLDWKGINPIHPCMIELPLLNVFEIYDTHIKINDTCVDILSYGTHYWEKRFKFQLQI